MGRDGPSLSRTISGEGPTVVLLHGLTAVGSQVIHGSRRLERAGFRTVAYDARAHGRSGIPSPDVPLEQAYGYPALADDLDAIISESVPDDEPFYLAGSSMGAHTAIGYALNNPERINGVVLIGPAYAGTTPDAESLESWDLLSIGLRDGGPEGFVEAYAKGLTATSEWRDRLIALARERIQLHEHPDALADALWWIPRSTPFSAIDDLADVSVPALVIASSDEADPGHPQAVAEAWSATIPGAELRVDRPGDTPTGWSGGRLSDAIAEFAAAHA